MAVRVAAPSFPRFSRWSCLVSLALSTGCSSLAGDRSGERYTAPEQLFSLPLPALSLGATIEDQCSTNPDTKLVVGMVSFHDDFGGLRVIQYEQLAAAVGREFSEPASASAALRGCLHDMTLARIQQFSPRTRLLREESVALPDGVTAWFAVLEIPEGSPMMETSAEHPEGRRLDSTRGFLLLCRRDGLFLTLSAANDNVFAHVLPDQASSGVASQAQMDELKDTLTRLYSSMSFG